MKKLFAFLLLLPLFSISQVKIPLKVSDAYQTNHVNQDVTYLIDGYITTRFNPGYNLTESPHDVVFDLSDYDPCTVQQFKFYDGNGASYTTNFYLVRKTDGYRYLAYTFTGGSYNTWITYNIPVDSQFVASKLIIETTNGGDVYPHEMEVWGTYTAHTDPTYTNVKAPLKNFLEADGHLWDFDSSYPKKIQALIDMKLHGARVYADVNRLKDSATGAYNIGFPIGGFKWEKGLKALNANDTAFFTQVSYQQRSLPAKASYDAHGLTNAWYKFYGTDSTQASAWDSMSHDHYVLTEFGGRNSSLSFNYPIALSNTVEKGTGIFDAIEEGNEWDNWYSGKAIQTYMTPEGQAAATSASYDGNKGELGTLHGVKNADSTMLVTNAGIAWDWPDYFRQMMEWFKAHRGYKANGSVDVPLDYWSFHCYSSSGGQYSGAKGGLPPEQGMVPQIKKMVYFSHKYGGEKPVVIGEWGYDVNAGSPLNAPAFNGHTAEQTRAIWSARAILSFMQYGVYRSQWFRLYENYYAGQGGYAISDSNSTQFETMALLRQYGDGVDSVKRTLVGDYFRQLAGYGDYTFDSTLRSDSLHVIRLKKDSNYLYAFWTEEQTTITNNVPSFVERTIYYNNAPAGTLATFNDAGQVSDMATSSFAGGTVTVNSKPFFIAVASTPPSEPTRLILKIPKGKKIILKQNQ